MENFIDFLEKSKKVIALDFDGVIHDDSKGFHDGTIYGLPIDGTESALIELSKNYKLIIFTCKANPKRPLVNEKTGVKLIWEWLEKWNFRQYISDVVWGKPNALIYIDDKGFRFNDWQTTIEYLNET
jgi:ribonucleotide monophosphatase NagD (HAD superfamily)